MRPYLETQLKLLSFMLVLLASLVLLPSSAAEAKVMVCRNAYTGAFVSAAFRRTNPHVRVICKLV